VLVIGGGMAAVVAAMEAAGKGASTVLVDQGAFLASGSSPVSLHGFGTTTSPDDSPDTLFKDLLRVGQSLNEQNLILEAAQGAAKNQRFFESIGIRFLRQPDGKYSYYKGVGHSVKRGLDVDKDLMGLSGLTVVGKEAWRRGVRLCDNVRVTKILGNKDGVTGALGVSRNGSFYLFDSKAVILAAGGANNLYPNACSQIKNHKYWTVGDAFALAFDLGVSLIDMEFPNFRRGEQPEYRGLAVSWLTLRVRRSCPSTTLSFWKTRPEVS
jgi:succinate dehydrogenase/fumarate reductase flavoprotein subunit